VPDPNDRGRPVLSEKGKIYLELAAQRVAAADREGVGSPAAIVLAQEAIGYTAFALSHHLEHLFPTKAMSEREGWLQLLRFLSGTLLFQYPLERLTHALTELDRGLVPSGLRRTDTAQGGKPTARKLVWMKSAVETVDGIIAQHGGGIGEAEGFIEDEAGVAPNTIRNWRRMLAKLAPEHHPRARDYSAIAPSPDVIERYEEKRLRLAPQIKALKMLRERAKKDY